MPDYRLTFQLIPWPFRTKELKTSLDPLAQAALTLRFALEDSWAETEKDQLIVCLAASDDQSAVDHAVSLANRFCVYLTLYQSQYFKAQIRSALNESQGRAAHIGGRLKCRSVRVFSPTYLGEDIKLAASGLSLKDPTLEKAVAYFYHALFLTYEVTEEVFGHESQDAPNPGRSAAFHDVLLLSGAILHHFKCAATIIGEPNDADFQSRYRKFDISEKLWCDTKKLWDIRSDWDVAHYTQGWEKLERLESHHQFAIETAQGVLRSYIDWRVKGG